MTTKAKARRLTTDERWSITGALYARAEEFHRDMRRNTEHASNALQPETREKFEGHARRYADKVVELERLARRVARLE